MDATSTPPSSLQKASRNTGLGDALRHTLWNAHGKNAFIASLAGDARVLDVGCGNNSPRHFRQLQPDAYYAGLDVSDYLQDTDPNTLANEYVVVPPDQFCNAIVRWAGAFDAVISAHNLEHCQDPDAVLTAMLRTLRANGRLYISFPCEASVSFPKRGGCLNFHDDPTHDKVPSYDRVLSIIKSEGFEITFAARRYRPWLKAILGAFMEPISRAKKQVKPGTWALWGFETVIWARRRAA
jgi:SAM-dependent methyltransferase